MIAAVDNDGAAEPASRPGRPGCRDAARLLELAHLMDRTDDLERQWPLVAEGIAALLGARGCVVVFSDSESDAVRRHASRGAAVSAGRSCAMATAPVHVGDDAIGLVQLLDAPDAMPFDAEHLAALRLAALMIGQSVHRARLHKLLHSRIAQLALVQPNGAPRGDALRDALAHRNGIGRLVARSLYREMVRAGFEAADIVGSASELISQLSAGLRQAPRARRAAAGDAAAADSDERRAA